MTLGISAYHIKNYEVETSIYSGPLDLLLFLIEKDQLDITKLTLAKVTEEYLTHLSRLIDYSPDEVSAFLVIAAKLIQIKSEILLPKPPQHIEEEEDTGESLARQLIEYKKFKTAALFLASKEALDQHTFLRLAVPIKVDPNPDLSGISLDDLKRMALALLVTLDERINLDSVVSIPLATIREKIRHITARLNKEGKITFFTLLFQNPLPIDIIVTFLAILELVKQDWILVSQVDLFSDIEITLKPGLDSSQQFDLEFGEASE